MHMSREKAPVFVVGCPRSGTTLLYHMLLSAGGFAVYLAESNVFNLLVPRFGDSGVLANRERLVESWLGSKLFRASYLDKDKIRAKLLEECKSGGDFLRIVMDEIARKQGAQRWADNSPEELLHMLTIQKCLPHALFIHMIRDGRDVALSLDARPHAWIRPFSWDRQNSLMVSGLFWEWMIGKGMEYGRKLGPNYTEIHFEGLLGQPQATLAKLGDFIQHDLDYGRILQTGIGSVREANTSFKGDATSPAGRWRKRMSPEKLALFEELVGPTLNQLGYPLASTRAPVSRLSTQRMRILYRGYLEAKFRFKNSGLGRAYLGPMSAEQIDQTVIATDPAAPPPVEAVAPRL
jgi:Sulfotransferase family